jgi:hypothetical protein
MKKNTLIIFIISLILISFLLGYNFLFAKSQGIGVKKNLSSEELVVLPEDGEVIKELIYLMSRTNPAILALKKSKLEALGAKLRDKVNTFEFLAFVFKDPELAFEMKILKESSIKYKRFLEGLHPKMLREYEGDIFLKRAHNFAKVLEIDSEEFKKILFSCLERAKDGDKVAFMPMVDFLIHKKAKDKTK